MQVLSASQDEPLRYPKLFEHYLITKAVFECIYMYAENPNRHESNIYRRSKVSPAVVFVVLKIFENSSGDDWVV